MPLPEALRPAYAELQRRLALGGVRWVEPHDLHLTLKFLGHLDPARLEAVCERLAGCAGGARATRLSAGEVTAFPRPRAARVLVVTLEDPAGTLPQLHGAIDERVSELGIEREERSFRFHVTLGRVRKGVMDARSALAGVPAPEGAWPVESFALFRSRLGRGGPTYEVLETFPLARGAVGSVLRRS